MEVPSCSASDPNTEYSVYLTNAYASKIELKGGLEYPSTLLLEDDLVTKELPSEINEKMIKIGEKIHQRIVKMIHNYTFVSDEELINKNETEVENVFHEFKKNSSDEENYEPQEKKRKKECFGFVRNKNKSSNTCSSTFYLEFKNPPEERMWAIKTKKLYKKVGTKYFIRR
ncbi:hypothetical protein M0802_015439 [Mischocyttarus mexicanus]|nr:hypothetical protein M0802_015439 [Mischocyttarus mexicanus]